MNGRWLNTKVEGDWDRFLKEGCGAPWVARKLMQSKRYGENELTHELTLSGFDSSGYQTADVTSVSTILSTDPDNADTIPRICQSRRESVMQSMVDDSGNTRQFKCFWDERPGATPPFSLVIAQPNGEVFDMERWVEGDTMHLSLSFPQRPHVPPVKRVFKRLQTRGAMAMP
jgi:hypothetical protein